jgi:hypothetical protein
MVETREEILRSTYRNAREGGARMKGMNGWESIRRTMVKTAWQVRREMRGAPMTRSA